MFSFLWSESKKRAVEDKKNFWDYEFDEFMQDVCRASVPMLLYEIKRYEELEFSIGLAKGSASQMELSGGKEWVEWKEERFLIEKRFVLTNLDRRGQLHLYKQLRKKFGGVDLAYHSWEILHYLKYPEQLEPTFNTRDKLLVSLQQTADKWGF